MPFEVLFHDEFVPELGDLPEAVQNEIYALAGLLREFGPALGRPHCDTLKGSEVANLKELRVRIKEAAWRVAFAFDPDRQAVLLVAGNKSGGSQARFYKNFIRKAETRFRDHVRKRK